MIKTLLKHHMSDMAINALFNNIQNAFIKLPKSEKRKCASLIDNQNNEIYFINLMYFSRNLRKNLIVTDIYVSNTTDISNEPAFIIEIHSTNLDRTKTYFLNSIRKQSEISVTYM